MRLRRPALATVLVAAALPLAGGSGFLGSAALGVGTATETVTISLTSGARGPAGEQGPAGERGPAGPAGERGPAGMECPAGYAATALLINHPGGQVTLWACLRQ